MLDNFLLEPVQEWKADKERLNWPYCPRYQNAQKELYANSKISALEHEFRLEHDALDLKADPNLELRVPKIFRGTLYVALDQTEQLVRQIYRGKNSIGSYHRFKLSPAAVLSEFQR
jgi:hypothetical protein